MTTPLPTTQEFVGGFADQNGNFAPATIRGAEQVGSVATSELIPTVETAEAQVAEAHPDTIVEEQAEVAAEIKEDVAALPNEAPAESTTDQTESTAA